MTALRERRSRGLEALQLLDTPPEERFDRFTRLAQVAFDVPLATITLIDPPRTFFKSCSAIPALPALPSRDDFAALVAAADEPVVVVDTRTDPRTRDLPTVRDAPWLRFYAGAPLHDDQDRPIGTLSLFDRRQHPDLEESQVQVLRELARWIDAELQTEGESERAQAVQDALQPPVAHVPGYQAAGTCLPTAVVAGDFLDHQQYGDQHLLALADVMGKGTGAAILSATVRAALRAEARAFHRASADGRPAERSLGDVVGAVNEILLDDLSSSRAFVTALVAWADPSSGTVRYVDAGHGLALAVRADGTLEQLQGADLPLGVDPGWVYSEHRTHLDPGDWIVCFSDGLLDLLGGRQEAIAEIGALVRACSSPGAFLGRVRALAEADSKRDDVTVLAVRRDPDRSEGGVR